MALAEIEGDFELPLYCHEAQHCPDVVSMCEDIEKEIRRLHNGRFIITIRGRDDIRMSFGSVRC